MALVDMAEVADKAEAAPTSYPEPVGPRYPYGLCISLCQDELTKLGLTDLPSIGTEMPLNAIAKVTSVSLNESEGHSNTRLELQITMLEIAPEPRSLQDRIKARYNAGEDT